MKGEGTSLAERPDALIVAAPRQAKLQAVVFVKKSQAIPHGGKAVRDRQGIFAFVGEIEDGRAEYRPIAIEQDPARQAKLLLVAEILDVRVDVPVEPKVAHLHVGLVRADCEVELAAAYLEAILVEPETVGEVDQAAVSDARSSDDVGKLVGQPGSFGEDRGLADDPIALPDGAGDRQVGSLERPVHSVGHAGTVLPAGVTGEAMARACQPSVPR